MKKYSVTVWLGDEQEPPTFFYKKDDAYNYAVKVSKEIFNGKIVVSHWRNVVKIWEHKMVITIEHGKKKAIKMK